MGEIYTHPHDFSDLRLTPSESLRTSDIKTLEKRDSGLVRKDVYTDYLPSKPEAKVIPLNTVPTLPPPEPPVLTGKKRKREENVDQIAQKQKVDNEETAVFKPFGHFGMPFNTSAGSEIGLTPHPQLVMAQTVEDCTRTMAIGREFTTKTILTVDHYEQDRVSQEFEKKLAESIRIARENQKLSYIKNALKFLGISIGIGGGIIVALGSSTTGNGWGTLYGMEMACGGLLELGSFCLDQISAKDSNSIWSSLMAIGGALLTFHGGLMGNNFLLEALPKNLGTITSTTFSLLQGYGVMKGLSNQAELLKFSGELTVLTKERKMVSDDIKKHYGALNITDFKNLFKTATDFVDQTNQAVKRITQGTLKG